jgi:argininosuccinate lyase
MNHLHAERRNLFASLHKNVIDMAKLWKKNDSKSDPVIERYTAGTDYIFDMRLMPYDITASRAHAKELTRIGILSKNELADISDAFDSLAQDWAHGKIVITPEDEDCHTVIENYLVEKIGVAGKKIHTGRSRNDQVLTAVRLYLKAYLQKIYSSTQDLAESFLKRAEKYQDIPMPGYSHTQQAMLTTVGHYYANFVESLLDDADFVAAAIKHLDKSPLGTAAGFGSSIPLDRERTAKDMGFGSIQINSLYAQNSRGKFESIAMEALAQVMLTLSRFATDMLFFISQEASFFTAGEAIVTGSSIMPQKRNLDPLELVRGNTSIVIANQLAIKDISKSLISGYNRDLQLIKKPLMESIDIVASSVDVIGIVLENLTPNTEIIAAKIHPGIFMADIANDMVRNDGIPFRDAYKRIKDMPVDAIDLAGNIASKKTLGAPGNLALDQYRKRIAKISR